MFNNITTVEIHEILLIARDNGNYHTPQPSRIEVIKNTEAAVYGRAKWRLHNNYSDKELMFNINANSVQIWEERTTVYSGGINPIKKHEYCAIYNLQWLVEKLKPFTKQPKK